MVKERGSVRNDPAFLCALQPFIVPFGRYFGVNISANQTDHLSC